MTHSHRPFWTIDELAKFLRVGRSWIYDRTRENGPELIPHIKVGKYLRFDPDSERFQGWLEDHQVGADVG